MNLTSCCIFLALHVFLSKLAANAKTAIILRRPHPGVSMNLQGTGLQKFNSYLFSSN